MEPTKDGAAMAWGQPVRAAAPVGPWEVHQLLQQHLGRSISSSGGTSGGVSTSPVARARLEQCVFLLGSTSNSLLPAGSSLVLPVPDFG